MATRTELMDRYRAILDRVEAWKRSESARLNQEILIPIFSQNMCVMHNSMLAYEEGRPWKELPKDYYKKGRYYNWKQEQIWAASRRLTQHFWDKWIEASRMTA